MLCIVAVHLHREAQVGDPIHVVSEVDVLGGAEASGQERPADEEHEGERDLDDDQSVTQLDPPSSSPRAFTRVLQGRNEIRP